MNEAGYIEIADLLTPAECVQIVDRCRALYVDSDNRHPRDKPASGTRHLEELDQRVPLVAEVLRRGALRHVVERALGTQTGDPAQVSLLSPQPGFGGQDLHRDTAESMQGPEPTVLTAIVALVDFTEQNGATRVVPGSHLTNESAARFRGRASSPDERLLTGPAGTAFVFTGHLLHSGTTNNSAEARPALQVLWRR